MTRIKTFADFWEARDFADRIPLRIAGSCWRVFTLTSAIRQRWWLFDTTRQFVIVQNPGQGDFADARMLAEDGVSWVKHEDRLVWIKSQLREQLDALVSGHRLSRDASWVSRIKKEITKLIDDNQTNDARLIMNQQG